MIFKQGNTYSIKNFNKNELKAVLDGMCIGVIILVIIFLLLDFAFFILLHWTGFTEIIGLIQSFNGCIMLLLILLAIIFLLFCSLYFISRLFIRNIFYYSNKKSFFEFYIFNKLKSRKELTHDDLKSIAVGCYPHLDIKGEKRIFYSVSIVFHKKKNKGKGKDLPNICLMPFTTEEPEVKKLLSKLIPLLNLKVDSLILDRDDIIIDHIDGFPVKNIGNYIKEA